MSEPTETAAEPEFRPIGDRRFRILSLDGGGIKGAFSATVLADFEEMTKRRIVDHFDLIAGTSTGGIVALGLALGIPAAQIKQLYVERGPQIFPATGLLPRWPLFRSKHRTEELEAALAGTFGERKLGEALTRVVIPAYDVARGDTYLFKTSHHPRLRRDCTRFARDVALATSAAPVFFPVFRNPDGLRCVDGGVWANNPSVVALAEAIGVLGCNPANIEILGIGTTSEPFFMPRKWQRAGLVGWIWRNRLRNLLMQAQMKGAVGITTAMTSPTRFLRIDETTAPGRFSLDNAREVSDLVALGQRAGMAAAEEVERRFLDEPADPFQPYVGVLQSGHGKYRAMTAQSE